MGQIKKPVGKGGKNEEDDVQAVQVLLNKFASVGGYSKLKEDGKCGPKTLAAIAAFQQKVVKMNRPDQRVDPGGGTIKKLNENPSSVAKAAKEDEEADKEDKEDKEDKASAGKGKGKVTGKTSGVRPYIINFLRAVADHYGKEIKVTSGKRNAKEQADVMWEYWDQTLDHGEVYIYIRKNPDLQKQLDGWYKKGDSESEKSFKSWVVQNAVALSRHLTGQAVDISLSVDPKILQVLQDNMKYVKETRKGTVTCHHFDDRIKPPPVVTDAMKAQWPKA